MRNKQYLLLDTLPVCKDLYWLSVIPNAKGTREDKKKIAFANKKIWCWNDYRASAFFTVNKHSTKQIKGYLPS